MNTFKWLFSLLLVAILMPALANNAEGTIPDLRGLAGKGIGKAYSFGTLDSTKSGKLIFIENYTVTGRQHCHGLQLWVSDKMIGAVALCGSDQYFICDQVGECDPTRWEAKVSGNTVQQYFLSPVKGELNFFVEIYADTFVYGSQRRNCLIKGPHAMCFFEGFGWVDAYRTKFTRINQLDAQLN